MKKQTAAEMLPELNCDSVSPQVSHRSTGGGLATAPAQRKSGRKVTGPTLEAEVRALSDKLERIVSANSTAVGELADKMNGLDRRFARMEALLMRVSGPATAAARLPSPEMSSRLSKMSSMEADPDKDDTPQHSAGTGTRSAERAGPTSTSIAERGQPPAPRPLFEM